MNLHEIYEDLQFGELSNLGLSDKDTGVIRPSLYPKILSSVNLGLTELHKRFLLKIGTLNLELQPGQTQYPLKPMYQVGQRGPKGVVQFILNDGVKFEDDLLKVEQVFTDKGVELWLNNHETFRSVFTPAYNVLEVRGDWVREDDVRTLRIKYRKSHRRLTIEEGVYDPLCLEVDLPYTHKQALLWFIASRLHNPVGFSQSTMHEGNNYAAKFEQECANLDAQNFRVDQVQENDRARKAGWP